ncbi:uncharacterized protein MAL8P1.12-like [Saccostrea cucullata]|uniref:uncharacterized protein MAL8P1.12-like n=1 Tax=Saccostrea cuccullata TaxID=36930 RepID=UPI002ED2A750
MSIPNPFCILIILFLFKTGEGSALLMHGNSNSSDVIQAIAGNTVGTTEIKQMVLNLTAEVENLKRQTETFGEEKKLLQNRIFFLEAELNKLNMSMSPSNDELMSYLRGTRQLVQTLAANEEYDKNLTLRLNEAEKNMAICIRQNKNLTQRFDDLVDNLLINDNHNKNLTQQLHEVENNLAANEINEKKLSRRLDDVVNALVINDEQNKNVTERLIEIMNKLIINDKRDKNLTEHLSEVVKNLVANEMYTKNLSQNLSETVNNLYDLKVQMRYISLSLLDVHSKTDNLNTTLSSFDVRLRDVNGRTTNITKKVAFTAGVSSSSTGWNSGTLVFDKIVYNIGGGYDPTTGVFTSPVDGYFVFFVNVQAYSSNSVYTNLILNGSAKVTTMAEGGPNNASPNLVVLRLQKGDRVWVKFYTGVGGYYSIRSAPTTTFSGFLIY